MYTSDSKQNICSFYPETNEAVLQGRVLSLSDADQKEDPANKSKAIRNCTVLVSTPDSIVNMQYTKTDSLDSFSFLLKRFYDGKEIFVRLKENVNATILLDNKFNLARPFAPSNIFNAVGIKDFLIRCRDVDLVQRTYSRQLVTDTIKKFMPANTIPRVYSKHYSSVAPDDYVELTDFAEISKEIIPALRVRKSEGRYFAGFVNFPEQSQGKSEPAIFLDGVPVDDVNQIITLGSNQISRIETLPVSRYYGDMSFAGIVAVFGKELIINNIQFKTPTLKCIALSSQSYTKPEPFKPEGNKKRIADLRQLLLWEPDITLGKSHNRQTDCYASDLQGKYRIDVQGITSDGKPVYGSAIVSVKSN